ncbi:hypothetical protein Glove_156g13 [Diversispora epigaea]|uniref:Kri1-like C-terminal domain-containing protein n=1 Tax=Diversispora epigaea TaxID=1348612 RepID=A0A397IWN2_9GLOM|nr:hypothetical protein Glove_156g13 [Diversispora epigaea]
MDTITINEEYARKYEERKRSEELSKLKEKYGKDIDLNSNEETDDSTSEEEDEYGDLITPEVDVQIMKTISAIKSKDPKVYNPNSNFFSEEEMKSAWQSWLNKKQQKDEKKPIYLKDYQRQILLEDGGDISNEEEEDDDMTKSKLEISSSKIGLTPVEEERKLKDEFKAAVSEFDGNDDNDDDDGDDFLVKRQKTDDELKKEEEEYQNFLLECMAKGNVGESVKMWQNYKKNPNVKEDDAFLMDYVLNRGWIDKDSTRIPTYEELITEHHDEEDEQFDEAVDNFESKYNFRFEEEGSSKITTYSRNAGDSVRRTDNKRKIKRKTIEERKKEEKQQKAEELKRLKNIKKREIFENLQKIKEITGNQSVGFNEIDLEEDFDPEKYDQKMSEVFNEEYYVQELDNEKPEWNEDIDIGDIGNHDDDDAGDIENYGDGDDGNFIMDADYLPGGENYEAKNTKKKRKHHQSEIKEEVKQKFDEYLDEYYQLDYEDIIDGTPVRFKYRQTKPVSFGLTPAEILVADENDLNEFISLKKLAPFRPDNVVNKDIKKYSKKKRIREFRKKLERAEIDNPPENKSWSIKSIKRKKLEAQEKIQEKQKSVKSNKKKKNRKNDDIGNESSLYPRDFQRSPIANLLKINKT